MADNRAKSPLLSAQFKAKVKQRKKQLGRPVSPDAELGDGNVVEDGAVVVYQSVTRLVTLHPGNIIKKSGRTVVLQEADALRVAEAADLPVPHVYGTERTPDGRNCIILDYIQGQTLSDIWMDLTEAEKRAFARQLRAILEKMRSIPAPRAYIGDCKGERIYELRLRSTYTGPPCHSEAEFNTYLLNNLYEQTPHAIRRALARRQRTDHRVVLTHGDLGPHNIIVRDGRIVGLIDWESSGWYPEYWEYVKFLQRMVSHKGDWTAYMDDIFPREYLDELADYIALSKWQPL
ncbi:Protein kinase-like domain protein [Niveomyces insectorum RCEF 264]|uniref:Protein kinase-like domain protein n=1 Tax=Niveomyces insectorum RCEF 264 TaxID=1081102 RepID=A0A167Z242_9HYPO|nr:Protein kinase-like domain protein [Niveomyces insectorum RCEF 264]